MSLRLYARIGDRQYQVLGNNEFPACLQEALNKQGAEVDADGCFGYDWKEGDIKQYTFKLKDLNSIIKALEQYIQQVQNDCVRKHSELPDIFKLSTIADFTQQVFEDEYNKERGLTYTVLELMDCGYLFCSANLIKFIGRENIDINYFKNPVTYDLKPGVDLYMYAY